MEKPEERPNAELIHREYTDGRLLKLEKRLDQVESSLNKLSGTVTQYAGATDSLTGTLSKLQVDIGEELNKAAEKIVQASKEYIDGRLGSTSTSGTGGVQGVAGNPERKGALDGNWDRLSPKIESVVDRYVNSANLPFLTPAQPAGGVGSDIVNLERQMKTVLEYKYRDILRKTVNEATKELGLPAAGEVPRLTHTP